MAFTLPELPYANDALAPVISAETIGYHYGKHHKAYVDKLNRAVSGTPWAEVDLDAIIRQVDPSDAAIFNNAAQVWNHTFYWRSMSPDGGGEPTGALASAFESSFGGFEAFKERFTRVATGRFGSGWAWLVAGDGGALEVVDTLNADNPLRHGQTPLLTCDVWEHAYYIDYRNARAEYVAAFWDLVSWDFVAQNLVK